MSNKVTAVRGMKDILPDETGQWQHVEAVLRKLMVSYGYHEIRFPIVESTNLFKRTIGEVTDIVAKEMYTFDDRNGDSLTLRPEGTAVCMRAGIEHGLFYNQVQRLWYRGPMFRYERPQRGRYRQFYQFGVEAVGMHGPDIDAELILLSARFWQVLGISDKLTLQINTLGSSESRQAYRDVLVAYFHEHISALDEDSVKRLETNPLRILDSKNPAMKDLIESAPSMHDAMDDVSKQHFSKLCAMLDAGGITYVINPHLVRGLDYYDYTVFEWVTDELGAQGTVCAGGRYNSLIAQLGGKQTPAIGFALGIERLLELIPTVKSSIPSAYMILVGDQASMKGLQLAEKLRDQLPSFSILMHCGGGSFKNQFKRADKSGATVAVVMGEQEIMDGVVTVKFLRDKGKEQISVAINELAALLKKEVT